jgi:hypothetical protein
MGRPSKRCAPSRTMPNDLLALADWLRAEGCGPVVRASTGSYWRPVLTLLEGQGEVLVVTASHAKAVPSRGARSGCGRDKAGRNADDAA